MSDWTKMPRWKRLLLSPLVVPLVPITSAAVILIRVLHSSAQGGAIVTFRPAIWPQLFLQ